jgi:16S rRNA (adenine(1408)-N(1))-methyltransferase
VTIDVGTGDGRAVLAAARREPDTLALGLDANAAAMVEASRRAARPARKGGLENARFVLGAAEALPPELAALADLVTVRFPWGSLLRGCVGLDPVVAAGLAGLVAPDGVLEVTLAPAERDGLDGVPTHAGEVATAASAAFARHGLELVNARAARGRELRETRSTWGSRLLTGGSGDRSVMILRLARLSR